MAPTALVTGASGGIGAAVARELGRDHDVVCHYHADREAAERVAAAVREGGQEATVVQGDVSDPAAVPALVEAGRSDLGPIDVLVNNAAVFHREGLETASVETIQRTLRVNLEGAVYCARAVLPGMRERGEGHIVNIASVAGTGGSPTDEAYAASKAGLLGLTRSLAARHTDAGVFTNAIAPGPVRTEMYAEDRRPAVREESPIDRLVRPQEVAAVVRLFATATAISGQTLVVDGGLTR